MQLYNTLARAKESFTIPTDRPVTLYVCGVTPYDTTHIGHARTFLIFDVLVRYLRWHGAEVRYCQNVTDVDDPLFERARRDGVGWRELAEQQVAQLVEDYQGLNIAPPTYFPRASEEIGAMIPIIARLVELGHAYVTEGNVYFSVKTDPEFGRMARLGYDGVESGTSVLALFQVFGPRISDIGSNGLPDYYEQPRPTLDLVFTQDLGAGFELSLRAKNLIDPPYEVTVGDKVARSEDGGRQFTVGVTMELE